MALRMAEKNPSELGWGNLFRATQRQVSAACVLSHNLQFLSIPQMGDARNISRHHRIYRDGGTLHTKQRAASESFRAESLGTSRFTLRGDLLPSSVTSGRHSYDVEAFVGSFGEHAFCQNLKCY